MLMALSNKFGSLLLTTGNKSEMAVGYCTLYGDMCGGLAVISDVFKTQVYALARWINDSAAGRADSRNSVDKPPSAELRPGQTDQDSLPPYDLLDAILRHYVVHVGPAELICAGVAARSGARHPEQSHLQRVQTPPGRTRPKSVASRLRHGAAGAGRAEVSGIKYGKFIPRPRCR